MADNDAAAIRSSLTAVNDTPSALRADAYEGGFAPSVISRGAEGITTFVGFDRRNGSANAVAWIADELSRELTPPQAGTDRSSGEADGVQDS